VWLVALMTQARRPRPGAITIPFSLRNVEDNLRAGGGLGLLVRGHQVRSTDCRPRGPRVQLARAPRALPTKRLT
jgi:hypothetical protein